MISPVQSSSSDEADTAELALTDAEQSTASAASIRDHVLERIRATRSAPRQLVKLDIPTELLALFNDAAIAKLRPAAVLVPLMDRPDGVRVLLTRRSTHLRTHAGQISFPGGRQDASDRDLVDTALREAEEEIGLPRQYVQHLGYLDDYPTVTGYRVTTVVGLVSHEAPLRADGREVDEILEVPLTFLLDPANYVLRKLMRDDGIEVPIIEIVYGPHRIWGATAGMLNNFREKIR